MLCPQFEVGANSDVWDEALQSTGAPDPRSSRSGLDKVAEAGKIWDKGRNWTTVVMEVVPGSILELERDAEFVEADDDVLEIPVFVRVEWEAEGGNEELPLRPDAKRPEVEMVKRELAYWMVLGVGRIKRRL
jgi:dynactin-4